MEDKADKSIECCDCGETFIWTMRDQEFYAENKFKPPKRCKPCRKVAKERRSKEKDGKR